MRKIRSPQTTGDDIPPGQNKSGGKGKILLLAREVLTETGESQKPEFPLDFAGQRGRMKPLLQNQTQEVASGAPGDAPPSYNPELWR